MGLPHSKSAFSAAKLASKAFAIAFAAISLMVTSWSALAMTAAGVIINNQATLAFQVGGTPSTQTSNVSSFSVAQLIDVIVAPAQSAAIASSSPDLNKAIAFTVTNSGNGQDVFRLSRIDNLPGDQFDPVPSSTAIYIENGLSPGFQADGPNRDTPYVGGTNDVALAAGESRTIYIVSDLMSGLANGAQGKSALNAESTLPDAPGSNPGNEISATRVPGVVTVVGLSRARSTAQWSYIISRVSMAFTKTLIKVSDKNGGSLIASGSMLSYRLTVALTGSGTAQGVEVIDPLPPQMRYRSGTLKVAGQSVTDAADADSGQVISNQIIARLGDVSAPNTIQVDFDVEID